MGQNTNRNDRRRKASSGDNRIRVRAKRLDQVDETKLTLAYWLLAKRLVEDRTNPRLPTEDEVVDEATRDDQATPGAAA